MKTSELHLATDIAANDLLQIVDRSDPAMNPISGTNKKITAVNAANELFQLVDNNSIVEKISLATTPLPGDILATASVDSDKIAIGTITNINISPNAEIALSKLGGGQLPPDITFDLENIEPNFENKTVIGENITAQSGTTISTITTKTANDISAEGPILKFERSRGTLTAPTTITASDELGEISFLGYNSAGTSHIISSSIKGVVDATPGSSDAPGRLIFSTNASGTTSVTERMRIDSAGNVGIGTVSPTSRLTVVNATTSDAVRITHTGTSGNALVIEDESPDTTPFVVSASGRVCIGSPTLHVAAVHTSSTNYSSPLSIIGTSNANTTLALSSYNTSTDATVAGSLSFNRSSTDTLSAHGLLGATGLHLGGVVFSGSDGTAFRRAAQIEALTDGVPGANSMPGRIVLATTSSGSSVPTERMRIDSAGNVGIGGAADSGRTLSIGKNITGNANSYSAFVAGTVQTDVTSSATIVGTNPSIIASHPGLINLNHFVAAKNTFNSSNITNQYGFRAEPSLVGAGYNYGFWGNIPAGTARTITTISRTAGVVLVATDTHGFVAGERVTISGLASPLNGINGTYTVKNVNTATSFTFDLAGSDIVSTSVAAGTATATGRYNFYAAGTAPNYFAGTIGVGNINPNQNYSIHAAKTIYSAEALRVGDSTVISEWSSTNTDIVARMTTGSSDFGTLISGESQGHVTVGLNSNDVNDGFQVISKSSGNATYNRNCFEVKSDGRVMVGTNTSSAKFTVVDNSAAPAVRITQSGAGDALVVEDDTNPDSTPFVINADGMVTSHGGYRLDTYGDTQSAYAYIGRKVRGTPAAPTSALNGDVMMSLVARGYDGADFRDSAYILAHVDGLVGQLPSSLTQGVEYRIVELGNANWAQIGVPAGTTPAVGTIFTKNSTAVTGTTGLAIRTSGDMPGRLSFWTAPDQSIPPVERMRINQAGNVGIGTTAPGHKLEVNGSFAATSKSFLIPHPTKEGKKLRHGSLEGPEHGVYVRGKVNDNVIELPEYWTKLVDPDTITVQLTAIGKGQTLYVEDIRDNKVYIGNDDTLSDTPNCFYFIQAERADIEKMDVEINFNQDNA